LGGSVDTVKKNAEALVAATKEIGLEVSADKTKYMVMSGDQNVGRIDSVRIDNSTFKRVEEFKYLGTALTDRNCIAEEIRSRLKSGNACYYLVQNLLSSRLLYKDLKIKIYRTKEIGLEVNAHETKYMVMSGDQNAGRIHKMKIDNSSIERVEEFKYLGTTLTDQNSIQEEIKSRLKSGNACYDSVQNLLSSRLLSKNVKIKIYRTIILPIVLYGCETWSLTLREERRLRVFENRVMGLRGTR